MKIDKLYTLSQFVDYVKANENKIGEDLRNKNIRITLANRDSWLLGLIYKYNEFLKQPLTKEMFVNDIEKPNWDDENINKFPKYNTVPENYYYDLGLWKEAEKKVIFCIDKIHEMGFNENEMIKNYNFNTLEYVANHSNREYVLKNVEI